VKSTPNLLTIGLAAVVIQAMHTKPEEGEAGPAGDRLACITIR
jgi:hypothetical protein